MSYSDVQFIDVPLGAADKEKAKKWFASLENAESLFEELIRSGYSVKVGYDKRNSCYVCFLAPTAQDDVNSGCILTSRSDHWWKAVMSAYYKHVVVMKRDWRPMKRAGSDFTDL